FLIENTIQAEEYIIREKTSGDMFYILHKGSVRITKNLMLEIEGIEADEKMLGRLTDQEHPAFGENGLLGTGNRTANVIAETECLMYTLSKNDFEKLVHQDAQIGYYVMYNCCIALIKSLDKADENVAKLATALSIAVKF
ncbi:MAG: cyclic nucleotide-binding domain-containing protein, partial [Candidatus Cloacimonetes bacterium]|nr:cyclic nucleotide-binding domain-containing protein [Candidatus Cloacimonadota bacterium]